PDADADPAAVPGEPEHDVRGPDDDLFGAGYRGTVRVILRGCDDDPDDVRVLKRGPGAYYVEPADADGGALPPDDEPDEVIYDDEAG
ncbi:MAG: hypothetical protein M3Q10_04105, partial [Chloroflexota bacterium]|nr:hypothetical protein [Chloroflexota bacterium]